MWKKTDFQLISCINNCRGKMSEKPPLGSQTQIFSNSNPSTLGFGTCSSPPALEVPPLIRPVHWRLVNIPRSHLGCNWGIEYHIQRDNDTVDGRNHKKSCTTWDVQNPVNNAISTISTGARFLNHQQEYDISFQHVPVQNLGDTERNNLFSLDMITWLHVYIEK